MSKNTLTLTEKNSIIQGYLEGKEPRDLAKEYDVPTKTIVDVVDNPVTRTTIEKEHLLLTRAKESRRIDEIKDEMLSFIRTSISEAMEEPKKIIFMDKISKMISDLDKISRLNRGDATSDQRVTETQVKVDVAKIVQSLKTTDEKREFLRKQAKLIDGDYEQAT